MKEKLKTIFLISVLLSFAVGTIYFVNMFIKISMRLFQ